MSGIYIPDIKAPKNCDNCIFQDWSNINQFYVCDAVQKRNPILFNGNTTRNVDAVRSGRADNCPLIPVPDHGKMIIRDGVVIEKDGSTDVRDYGKEII